MNSLHTYKKIERTDFLVAYAQRSISSLLNGFRLKNLNVPIYSSEYYWLKTLEKPAFIQFIGHLNSSRFPKIDSLNRTKSQCWHQCHQTHSNRRGCVCFNCRRYWICRRCVQSNYHRRDGVVYNKKKSNKWIKSIQWSCKILS